MAFFLLLLLFLSYAPLLPLSSTLHHHHRRRRRLLHQPFFPQTSSQPPSPPPPPPTPTQLPFFPTLPSPSPPSSPPSSPTLSPPSSLSSFPANISSLSLPHPPNPNPESSSSLLALAISLSLAAALITAVSLLLFLRRRKRRSSGVPEPQGFNSEVPKQRRSAPTSSEFLYLGTIAASGGGGVDSRRTESPELRPLPPLGRNNHRSYEEEHEEFYSPKGSSAGAGSRRGSAAAAAANSTSSLYSSSSESNRSTISPPGMAQLADLKSSLSLSPTSSLSSHRDSDKSLNSSSNKSTKLDNNYNNNQNQNAHLHNIGQFNKSPSISPISSPERPLDNIPVVYLNKIGQFNKSPSISPMSSPDRPLLSSPRKSDGSDRTVNSPIKLSKLVHFGSKRISRSSSLSSSPSSPYKTLNLSKRSLPVSIIPPPPVPPGGDMEIPVLTPPVREPSLRPPALAAPLRASLDFYSPNSVSPLELPTDINKVEESEGMVRPKLKPLHWDKVRASSDREMVWDQLKSSSFRLNEEMIETLFVVNTPNSSTKDSIRRTILSSTNQEIRVIDPKKAQNIAISLRALNVNIEEVCDAITQGNPDALGAELLESLLKMAPTKDEERKLREFKDDSPFKLGPAEKFLKAMLDIPCAFKRVEAMLYIVNFESDVEYLKKSFDTLEAACEELRSSRMFLKLLEAVLKTGNRMNVGTNRGDAHAFKLDTLLKLADVKGTDGKTTLLHFVVKEIINTEAARLPGGSPDDARCHDLGLGVVVALGSELANVKKAADMDSDVLNGELAKLSKGVENIGEVVKLCELMESISNFVKVAEEEIIRVKAREGVVLSLVREITEYFHGNSAKEEARPFRIFMVVRDFLTVLDRVCKEIGMINDRTIVSSGHRFPVPVNPMMQPPISGFSRRMDYHLSDDER